MPAEFTHQPDKLNLPANVHQLLDSSLQPADELNAIHRATEKFHVAERPDLFVRLNRDEPVEGIHDALRATVNLRNYGMNILPFALVDHRDQAYVITQKVHGHTLSSILSPASSKQLVKELEANWEGLGRSMYDSMVHGEPLLRDIEAPHQYMLGITATDSRSKVWLTDLPESSYTPRYEDDYASAATYLAGGIVEVENLIHRRMPKARNVTEQIINSRSREQALTRAKLRMAQYVLAHNVVLSPLEDDEVDQFWDDV